jgi:hypothetical protein
MIADRPSLPQLEHRPFLTDSGLETTLIFKQGIELPSFAVFVLLETPDGRRRLRHYFERHAEIALRAVERFIASDARSREGRCSLASCLSSPTFSASPTPAPASRTPSPAGNGHATPLTP